ncbi:MAG: hypothetical protein U9Q29_03165, partial [Campylobacterota bacterium]|nr:hypothetical protein [Campylobacterota bacterium]
FVYNIAMAKIDEIKESIGYLKVVFSILIAINVSLVAWLYKNYETVNFVDSIVLLILSILISVGIVYINRKILSKIRSLRDL